MNGVLLLLLLLLWLRLLLRLLLLLLLLPFVGPHLLLLLALCIRRPRLVASTT